MARDPKRARVRLNVTSHHNKHKIKKTKKTKNKKPKNPKKEFTNPNTEK